jgi:hypothetical protein
VPLITALTRYFVTSMPPDDAIEAVILGIVVVDIGVAAGCAREADNRAAVERAGRLTGVA